MRIDLSDLIKALGGWVLCIDECGDGCTICVELPEELKDLDDNKKLYVALYISARKILDYRLVSAMHIHFVRTRSIVEPRILVKALSKAKFSSKIPPTIEDIDNPYAWEAVKWRGIAYATMVLNSERRCDRSGADSEDTFSLFLSLP